MSSQPVLDGQAFSKMVRAGAECLAQNVEKMNQLNVFPVPDGDTGTNMNLSFRAGLKEVDKVQSAALSEVARAFSKGLLMGARGNSGVILSQLFRGFASGVADKQAVNPDQFAAALKEGVEMAYKAVIKPVEGTILTVARRAARAARNVARHTDDWEELMAGVLEEARRALAQTPELLPVLKQVGVVDSGGQGLVYIYEGFYAQIKDSHKEEEAFQRQEPSSLSGNSSKREQPLKHQWQQSFHTPVHGDELLHHQRGAASSEGIQDQSGQSREAIPFGYCTEIMIKLDQRFEETAFRRKIGNFGDSLLVVTDEDLVKVHIHTEAPGHVLNYAQTFGELSMIKIENMRVQYREIFQQQGDRQKKRETDAKVTETSTSSQISPETVPGVTLAAVVNGKGFEEIFRSLGAGGIIYGGQTMNPSTEEIAGVLRNMEGSAYLLLPNNRNIVMAAEQAVALIEKPVAVLPSRSIPEGIAAMLAFHPGLELEENAEAMKEAMGRVKTGEVTRSVRDTTIEGRAIHEGDFLGIFDGRVISVRPDLMTCFLETLQEMVDETSEVLSLYIGQGAGAGWSVQAEEQIREHFPHLEVEIHDGGQPLYPVIFSLE